MDFGDLNDRPLKKRRFFVDEEAPSPATKEVSATGADTDASAPRSSHLDEGNNDFSTGHGEQVESPSNGRTPLRPSVPFFSNDHFHIASDPYVRTQINGHERTAEDATIHDNGLLGQTNTHNTNDINGDAVPTSNDTAEARRLGEESTVEETLEQGNANGFDTEAFTSIVGEQLPADTIRKIRNVAGDDLERAVNVYFDGSWKTSTSRAVSQTTLIPRERTTPSQPTPVERSPTQDASAPRRTGQPLVRYIGAFGVGAWATRSGMGLLKHGDKVNIERARSQPVSKRGRGGRLITNQKGDVLTRFTNSAGQEIGRLPRETAEWVSTLIDQKACKFEGVCVYSPDRVRVNDTIYLQLWCYLRIEAFQPWIVDSSLDDNRSTTIFEEQESAEEKRLRLRQVALVHLFDEIGLNPTSINDMTRKHKKEGLLRAAEIAEQYDKNKKESKSNGNSSEEEDSGELEEDQLDTLYKKAQSFDFNMPTAEPPSTFTMNLRKYQMQALHWMLAKERDNKSGRERSMHPLWEEYVWPAKDVDDNNLPVVEGVDHFYVNPYSGELSLEFPAQEQHCLGGILADEMGLGKTIEMMALVHSHRNVYPDHADSAPSSVSDLTRLPVSSNAVVPAPYTTLVVAPTSLISQWESEALKASQEGTMKVHLYYGNDKLVDLRTLCSANNPEAPNVIVTSYGVVLSEYRYFISQMSSSISTGGLFSVEFFRVILDEAHMIKNRLSKSARACYDLKATHRWVLTGTPIVNRLEDLFSLVRFLKVEPWNNFSFWKTFITVPFESKDYVRALNVVQSVLEPLVLRRTKTMKTPEGEPLVPLPRRTITVEEIQLSDQEREIYDYIYTRAKRTFNENVEAGTLLKSFTTIFAQILRLRQTCCHPVLTRNKAIVADEEDAAAAADDGNGLKDDMDLQELINKFTTATEEADSNETQDSSTKFTTYALKQIQNESSGECPICSEEPMIEPAVTACWHSACKKCLEDYIRHQTDKGDSPRCFSCRAPVSNRDIFEVIRHQSPNTTPTAETDIYSSTPPTSTQSAPRISLRRINPLSPTAHTCAKIHSLINHLHRVPSNTKSVVFSQFTSFLDLIGPQLDREGIPYLRLDGTMPQKQRAQVLAQFTKLDSYDQEDIEDESEPGTTTPFRLNSTAKKPPAPTPRVLLISLRAGGVGLNLTAASNVFMMDPWWSFAIEAQAIDRVHRMGQLRDVSVTRFIVKDSIEGRMLRVQERKMNIAGSLGLRVGGDGGEDDKKKDRIEELKLLFE
ncbi:DEAD/DEAH box helicase [Aspergillus melleus]|uniref:DEAD/DEAH box helicase n=1 Tax=Aspergillus melleus TaxID=138277 RepID=UPI001E8DC0CC|nr:DNA helicase rad5 [Aspergillus melleus]KAH8427201.1 DNA helicase rad5 [Aspergillus melleus]